MNILIISLLLAHVLLSYEDAAPVVTGPAIAAPLAAAPIRYAVAPISDAEDTYDEYQFAYSVHSSITGDSKIQEESRSGDIVRGLYSFIQPDGIQRTVNYYSDPLSGFNAVVSNSVPVAAPPAKIVAA